MKINTRYYNNDIDDDLPYVGELKLDSETGHIYDEELDALDKNTISLLCSGDGRGDDENE